MQVTLGFQIVLFFFDLQIDVHLWSQVISFLLVGVLVVGSVRGFLVTILRIFRQVSTTLSSNTMVLVLGQLMGMYFTSSILLMRMNLPREYRSAVSAVLGDIEFNFYHRFFNRIFLSSAFVSIFVLAALHRSKRSHDDLPERVGEKMA